MFDDEYNRIEHSRSPDEYHLINESHKHKDEMNIKYHSDIQTSKKSNHFSKLTRLVRSALVVVVATPVIVLAAAQAEKPMMDLEIYDLGYHHLTLLVRYEGKATVYLEGFDYQETYDIAPYEYHYQEEYPNEYLEEYIPEYYIEFFGLVDGYWYNLKVVDESGQVIHDQDIQTEVLVSIDELPPPEISYFSYYSDLVNQTISIYVSFMDPDYFLYDFEYELIVNDMVYPLDELSGSRYGGLIDVSMFDGNIYYEIRITAKSRHPLDAGQQIYQYEIYYE